MNTDLERRVAAELRAELARHGRSRHWLAEATGIPVTTIARWLRGPWFPGLNELDAIARALNMTVMDLLAAAEHQRTAIRSSADLATATVGAQAPVAQRIEHLTTDQKQDRHFVRPRRDRRRRRDWQRTAAPLHLSLVRCEDAA